jgi:chromosomal replication initiator protein
MVNKSAQDIWSEAQKNLREKLNDMEFVWFANLECAGFSDEGIILVAPTKLHAEKLAKKYAPLIAEAVREVTGLAVAVSITSSGSESPPKPEARAPETAALRKRDAPAAAAHPSPSPRVSRKTIGELLRPDYTFDKYIVGDNNSFAANAAKAVAKNPGFSYNPLLIYGGIGLGKTHLMQAIGNALLEKDECKVIYTTAENFTNEFIESTGTVTQGRSRMAAFKNKYRHTDALLIDDIHFFSNKEGTQEELFHTFNALYDANKQIVFTCDRPIAELKNITDRLKSRFERGLNVDLKPPNYETKCAILRSKLADKVVNIPDSVIDLISKNISTNVRDLEATLTKVIAYAELVNKNITLEIAQEQLRDLFVNTSGQTAHITMERIVRVIADHFKLKPDSIRARQKDKKIVYPRQLAMHIARKITEFTTTEIGGYFNKDYSTVIHSDKMINKRVTASPAEEALIQSLIQDIKETPSH